MAPERNKPMELLAPAGDLACLEAAIEAGADAAYLGLSLLNARRGAKNFTPAELERGVDLAHQNDVAVHLAVNIDVSRREAGAAARILAMAQDFGIDAIIARDWAVVALWRAMADAATAKGEAFPALHLSTQTAVTSREGARLAREVGAARVVLAREMSLSEIRAVSSLDDLEIEVFAQGALCYSVSGRCLLSSWGGGRSGNRGLCTSPCRVPWAVDGDGVGAAMSMRDLVTVDRLREIAGAGVDALKIEGRLKRPDWIREAVSVYRQALGPRRGQERNPESSVGNAMVRARRLADYAGRDITSAYLDGNFSGLTGVAARKSSRASTDAIAEFLDEKAVLDSGRSGRSGKVADAGYSLEVTVTDTGISCRCVYRDRSHSWRLPKTRIKREKKAATLADLFEQLRGSSQDGPALAEHYTNEPDFLLPPRNVKAMLTAVRTFVNRVSGSDDDGTDAVLKAPLPDAMRPILAVPERHSDNVRRLGERPNQVRVAVKQFNPELATMFRGMNKVVVNACAGDVDAMCKLTDPAELIVAFPDVYFPSDSEDLAMMAKYCRERGIRAEANCWGSLQLCREHKVEFVAGPGLGVLNHVAVKCLLDLGAREVTMSMEADRSQIEDVSAASVLPLTLVIYSRPVLAHTRIPRGDLLPPDHKTEGIAGAWTDRRGISLSPEAGRSTTFFRSLTPFDWKTLRNDKIRVANLSVDLSGESMPMESWKRFNRPGGKRGFLFNYDRGLK